MYSSQYFMLYLCILIVHKGIRLSKKEILTMRLRLIVRRNPSQISGLAGLWLGAVQSFRDGQCNTAKILYNTKQKSRTNSPYIRSAFLLLHYSSIQSTFYEKAMCNIPARKPRRDFCGPACSLLKYGPMCPQGSTRHKS